MTLVSWLQNGHKHLLQVIHQYYIESWDQFVTVAKLLVTSEQYFCTQYTGAYHGQHTSAGRVENGDLALLAEPNTFTMVYFTLSRCHVDYTKL